MVHLPASLLSQAKEQETKSKRRQWNSAVTQNLLPALLCHALTDEAPLFQGREDHSTTLQLL